MADWTSSMQQTFEYYIVDPNTWKDSKQLKNVKSCTINRDLEAETLGSATFDVAESLGECYIRAYLVTIQNGVTEKHPLGTYLCQTPSVNFDGKAKSVSLDAYTPLLELKESPPPLGYSRLKGDNIMQAAYQLCREHARAPVYETKCSDTLHKDFVSNTNDTWLTYISDLVNTAKYELSLDELGRILFSPRQDTASLQPVWTYDDSDKSILYHDISIDRDLYGIPNVVEVIYSTNYDNYYARAVNDNPNSPISTVSRGREIIHRVTNPDFSGYPDEGIVREYANQLLRDLSALECTVSYSHGYCPTRIGDCVRLITSKGESIDVKAKVIGQSIKCEAGCRVSEKAVFTTKLWG